MRKSRFLPFLLLSLFLMALPAAFAKSPSSPDPNLEALQSLLNDLEKSIEEADKRMVAHPRFLDDLRALVDRYRRQLREIYFYEDFADGDFSSNPEWEVQSGLFELTSGNRLWSRVYMTAPAQPAQEEEAPIGIILKEIMRASQKDRKKEEESPPPQEREAVIRTLAKIGPTFELDLTFVSKSEWGSMEIVLLGGEPLSPRYRLIYRAAASQQRPIELARERGSRSYIIESATQYPNLDDGAPHKIQWIRDMSGEMRVLVDGMVVLSTVEVYYRDDFTGLALVNRGGTYEWGPIQVVKAAEPEQK